MLNGNKTLFQETIHRLKVDFTLRPVNTCAPIKWFVQIIFHRGQVGDGQLYNPSLRQNNFRYLGWSIVVFLVASFHHKFPCHMVPFHIHNLWLSIWHMKINWHTQMVTGALWHYHKLTLTNRHNAVGHIHLVTYPCITMLESHTLRHTWLVTHCSSHMAHHTLLVTLYSTHTPLHHPAHILCYALLYFNVFQLQSDGKTAIKYRNAWQEVCGKECMTRSVWQSMHDEGYMKRGVTSSVWRVVCDEQCVTSCALKAVWQAACD